MRSLPQRLIEFALNVDQPSAQWSHFFFEDENIAGLHLFDKIRLRHGLRTRGGLAAA
jgi:hypothetical protein